MRIRALVAACFMLSLLSIALVGCAPADSGGSTEEPATNMTTGE